jgi:hypothetical protein
MSVTAIWEAVLPEAMQLQEASLVKIVDSLTLRNQAYQVLYALGDDPSTVRTLSDGEAACIVGLVRDMDGSTYLEQMLARRMSPRMIEYVRGHRP